MPEFVSPFTGVVPRKISKAELIRAIRLDISAEQEAVHLYEAHADATDIPLAARVLREVAREERVHIGEFQKLLSILDPEELATLAEGAAEVEEMARNGDMPAGGEQADNGQAAPQGNGQEDIPSVGDLRP